MSDYTVKREKEGILRIQAEGTKMPGPLTINERDYADDKQLIVGGGSSSLVGLAKVRFVKSDSHVTLSSCFANLIGLPVYMQASDEYTETAGIYTSDRPLTEWNAAMDTVDNGTMFLIAPCVLYRINEFAYTLEGNAEFGDDADGEYIKITGDCTITIEAEDKE